jgi:hypothetical protein
MSTDISQEQAEPQLYLPHAGFLLGVFFNSEDGGNMLL